MQCKIAITIFLFCMACDTIPAHAIADDSSIIIGEWNAGKKCAQGNAMAWLSTGSTLLYQVEVPIYGNFELHTLPGQYHLLMNNEKGCKAEQSIEIKAGESKSLHFTLLPPPKKRNPAGVAK